MKGLSSHDKCGGRSLSPSQCCLLQVCQLLSKVLNDESNYSGSHLRAQCCFIELQDGLGLKRPQTSSSFRTTVGFPLPRQGSPQRYLGPLTFRLGSFSGPLSLSDLLFSAVLRSSACKRMDTGIISRIKQGFLAGESGPEPLPTRTCKNFSEKISRRGRIASGAPNQTGVGKKRSQKATGA